LCDADISPLVAKSDDPKMAEDHGVLDVVAQLDKACTEAGFFYVVIFSSINLFLFKIFQRSQQICQICLVWLLVIVKKMLFLDQKKNVVFRLCKKICFLKMLLGPLKLPTVTLMLTVYKWPHDISIIKKSI